MNCLFVYNYVTTAKSRVTSMANGPVCNLLLYIRSKKIILMKSMVELKSAFAQLSSGTKK